MRTLPAIALGVALMSTAAVVSPAVAEPGLTPGTCVRVDKLYNGVVIAAMPENNNAYRIKDSRGGPDYIASERTTVRGACVGGAPAAQPAPAARPAPGAAARAAQPRQQAQAAQARAPAGACFASDSDARGATAQERAFRGAIRRSLEQKAGTGQDGAITVRFQTFRISPGRAADIIDRVNYRPDLSKPIYTVRTQFETCTDYRTATTTKQLERNFACFTENTGAIACMPSGTTAGLRRETSQYVPK